MTRLLLASTSPARLATLRSAGIEPVVHDPEVDEEQVLASTEARFGKLAPEDAALTLARAKAEAVSARAAGEFLVLGCDSILELEGQIYGKPASAADAASRWRTMRGRTGALHTGHWLVDIRSTTAAGTGGAIGSTASTRVHFAELTDAEIDAYVATEEPLRVAGAFTVDGYGGPFVAGLEGDHHNVVGLSLPLLRNLLADFGVAITDLWR
ncbi:septum formation inhibitor Maf [Actinobacteria bacterium YIM 96077]|uniref:Nucleoside triphosphate pyrophosphatase n=1 Tax=Phytoactinopolyspora halophila TaxID=1981511 RepID=A0A329QKD9_9ACTN|nr:nucleoside triphosphate pyrophosphatase [Phytoactinopolyspora halophila]AYY14407.1 septum formation inhibitor Maf [Actinobacteria bacterium YIM 96077]RAW11872.1 septum formation inhibitor Maf [Phytoactinopolyspora halophila]